MSLLDTRFRADNADAMAVIRSPRLRTAAFALLVVAAGGGAAARLVRAQSLAEVAKKEEERRKAVPAPTKVYTNKDLTAVPPGSPPPSSGTSSSTTPPTDTDKAKDAKEPPADKPEKGIEQPKDQAYWSGRLKTLREKLDRDTAFADALQTKVNSLTTDFVNRDDPAQRTAIERDRQKALAQVVAVQKDIAIGKKAIADLLEEARRAGVPAGWVR
jgi:hypothetical protein